MTLPKLWDIQWPVGPNTIEAINANFDFLFRRIAALTSASGSSGGGGSSVVVQSGIQSVTGTANQVLVAGTEAVVLSLPQSISTGSAVEFSTLSLANALSPGDGGTGQGVYAKGDLLVGAVPNTLVLLPVGSDGQVLTCSSASTSGLSWNTASAGGGTHSLLSTTHNDVTTASVTRGDLIAGRGSPSTWAVLSKGTTGDVLTMGADEPYWTASAGGVSTHALLSDVHSDVTTASPVRGDVIVAQGATPKWARLAKGTAGHALIMGADEPAWAAEGDPKFALTQRYGFMVPSETTLTVTAVGDGTFRVKLDPTGADWRYFRAGVLCTITGDKEVLLAGTNPPDEGEHYIYLDSEDGTLVDGDAWTLLDTKVPVCMVHFHGALTPKFWYADERHTCLIDRKMHYYEHVGEGTKHIGGGVISGQTVDPATPNDGHNSCAISEALILDEDLSHTLPALADPGGLSADYLLFYRTASDAWAWEYGFMPYRYTTSGYIQYDNAGTMTEGQSNKFYNSYLLYTNMNGGGFVFFNGRGEYASLAAAQAESPGAFSFAGLGVVEYVIAYQLTWRSLTSYGTKGKVRLAATPVVIDISGGSAAIALTMDHNSLAGLQGGSSTERYHVTALQEGGQFDALGAGVAVEAGSKLKVGGHAYIVQYDAGTGGAAKTIDWQNSNEQILELTADCTLTFSNPKAGGRYVLRLAQDGTGGWAVTWPASVVWSGGIEATIDDDASALSLVAFYYDGTNYVAAGANSSAAAQGMPEVPLAVVHGGTGHFEIEDGELLVGNQAGGLKKLAAPSTSSLVLASDTAVDGKVAWQALVTPGSCAVYMTSDTVATNGVEFGVTFDAESWDTDSYHSLTTTPERVTIPTGRGGVYFVTAGIAWEGQVAVGGEYYTRVYVNGTLAAETANPFSYLVGGQASCPGNLAMLLNLEDGDYLEMKGYMKVGESVTVYGGLYRTYLRIAQVI